MEKIDINTWLQLLGMLAAVIIFLYKGASKVEKNDLNLAHEVEKNKTEIENNKIEIEKVSKIVSEKADVKAIDKIDERLVKIENIVINKAVTDALLNQNVEHISKTIDKLERMQEEVLSKTVNFFIALQQNQEKKGGSL